MLHLFHPNILGNAVMRFCECCPRPQMEPACRGDTCVFSSAYLSRTCEYKRCLMPLSPEWIYCVPVFLGGVSPAGIGLVREVHEGWSLSRASLKGHLYRLLSGQVHSNTSGRLFIPVALGLDTLRQPLICCFLVRTPAHFSSLAHFWDF